MINPVSTNSPFNGITPLYSGAPSSSTETAEPAFPVADSNSNQNIDRSELALPFTAAPAVSQDMRSSDLANRLRQRLAGQYAAIYNSTALALPRSSLEPLAAERPRLDVIA